MRGQRGFGGSNHATKPRAVTIGQSEIGKSFGDELSATRLVRAGDMIE